MTLAGLTLPFVTESDPDTLGEGSLDPLGLAGLADRLADEIAPEVTARMSRIRFLTAIAACSHLAEEPVDLVGPAGAPAYLAFEWHAVEAFVRSAPMGGTDAVPGIQKARRRLRNSKHHLDAGSYLQTPKVFGFHGVYKRLAKNLAIVDDALVLLTRGDELLRTWEVEQGLDGFTRRLKGTPGGRLARELDRQVRQALEHGEVRLGPTSGFWAEISRAFGPGNAGARERRLLWRWLTDQTEPVRMELVKLVAPEAQHEDGEREAVARLLEQPASPELRARVLAIESFEAFVRPLDDAFQLLRVRASNVRPSAVRVGELASHAALENIAGSLPARFDAAAARIDPLGLGQQLEQELGVFGERMAPEQLVEAVLDRHELVQGRKGKRPWFERDERGFAVRGVGYADHPFEPRTAFLHPYRIRSIRSFCRDLRPGGTS